MLVFHLTTSVLAFNEWNGFDEFFIMGVTDAWCDLPDLGFDIFKLMQI